MIAEVGAEPSVGFNLVLNLGKPTDAFTRWSGTNLNSGHLLSVLLETPELRIRSNRLVFREDREHYSCRSSVWSKWSFHLKCWKSSFLSSFLPLHCTVVQNRWLHHLWCFRLVSPDLLMKWSLSAVLLKQTWNSCPKHCSGEERTTFIGLISSITDRGGVVWCGVREDGLHMWHVSERSTAFRGENFTVIWRY